ncbi:hypothetical protein [Gaetbulibacter sp. NE]|uniref:hypothetical protein n=1 Tax=Gaetbulibacter sp. NE TaxID=2982307 RepID=UPI0021CE5A1D|nr:hypothetical protein [Gaetbulibacter sp. NE]
MLEILQNISLTIIGIIIGFAGNYYLAIFNARNELKKEIAMKRATYYIELWKLCEYNLTTKDAQIEKLNNMKQWYDDGGGLLLPFKATNRLLGAIKILKKKEELNDVDISNLKENLTWLRTEMKYEVGSYSRKEAKTKLPSTK